MRTGEDSTLPRGRGGWVAAWAVVGSSWRRVGGALGYGGGLGRGFSWVFAKVGDGGARERLWPSEGRGEGEGAWRHHGREGEMKIRFRVRFRLGDNYIGGKYWVVDLGLDNGFGSGI